MTPNFLSVHVLGQCINASPAGKRRIAAGAEQQFGNNDGYNMGLSDGEPTGVLSQVVSPFTTITAIAVAGCLMIVTIFAIIFAILQVSIIFFNKTKKIYDVYIETECRVFTPNCLQNTIRGRRFRLSFKIY